MPHPLSVLFFLPPFFFIRFYATGSLHLPLQEGEKEKKKKGDRPQRKAQIWVFTTQMSLPVTIDASPTRPPTEDAKRSEDMASESCSLAATVDSLRAILLHIRADNAQTLYQTQAALLCGQLQLGWSSAALPEE